VKWAAAVRWTAAGIGLAAGVLLSASPAFGAFPGRNGSIAFTSDALTCSQGCAHTLFTINPDGSQLTSLGTYTAAGPAWSPDGTRLAFEAFPLRIDGAGIYIREPDGTLTQLTATVSDKEPTWSPDGTKIAFTRFIDTPGIGGDDEIHVMNADGTGVTRLTYSQADGLGFDSFDPAWSPDGTKIAFTRVIRGGFEVDTEIYVMNADGTDVTRLTHNFTPNNVIADQNDSGPEWSPDGKLIAFSGRFDDNSDIYVMRPDGTQLTRLTTHFGFDRAPAWSPDGTKIAYLDSFADLVVIDADGTDAVVLTPFGSREGDPSWQPIPNKPPDCSAVSAAPARLAPPNHKLVTVKLSGASDPDGDPVTLTIDGVTQDEPVGPIPDARPGQLTDEVMLRAERAARGDGRVYRIAFTASDGEGGECSGEATIEVRRQPKQPAVDSAPPSYDSLRSGTP
jgi:TolB protein